DLIGYEDSGAQAFPNWATFNPGADNESGQSVLAYHILNVSNPALFSALPNLDNNGQLTYTPAANASGSSTVTVVVQDNGGTANGGVDTSTSQTFTITINSANDPPSFLKGVDQVINEDAGTQTIANWATDLSAGPADEIGQTLAFQILSNT